MRGWPLLQFPNQQLESSYHASRSKLFLQVDAWHALLVLLFTPAWLALEFPSWASTTDSGAESCISAYVPFLQAYVRVCNIRAWLVGLCIACCAARLLLLAALWLAPARFLQVRRHVIAAVLLMDACACTLLRSTHCSLQLLGLRCRQSLAADVCMAVSFVLWLLPVSAALPYCAAYWAGSSLLQQALLQTPTAIAAAQSHWVNSEQLVRLLVQLVTPVAVLYWLERRSRKAFVAAQAREAAGGQGQQEQQQLAGQPGSPVFAGSEHQEKDAPETPDAPGESGRRAARQQDLQTTAAAAGSLLPAAAAAAGASTAVAAAGVAGPPVPADPDAAAAAAALLAYHSPFRRRTITVKVQAPEEGLQEPGFDPAARLTAAVQAAVAALPGGERTVIANQVCIPGCLLYLGRLLVTGKKRRSEQQQQQRQLQLQQQWEPPACQDGTWSVQLSSTAAAASSSSRRPAAGAAAAAAAAAPPLVYQTLDDLDAAARDGRLQAGIQGVLQRQAIEPCPASHVVTTWGGRLQLALWWRTQQQQQQQQQQPLSPWTRQRQQQATLAASTAAAMADGGSSSTAAMDGPGLCVRAVLSLGSRVLLDMQQLLPHSAPPAAAAEVGMSSSQWCSVQIDLPPASGSGSSSSGGAASSSSSVSGIPGNRHNSNATAVLTLYILPAESSAPGGDCAPLGDVTLLLLPNDAATELTSFVEHNRFTQQLLQPLLTDMAVAVAEGTALRNSDGSSAELLAAATAWHAMRAFNSADHNSGSSSSSTGADGLRADDAMFDYLAAASEAAGKVRQFLASVGTLERCEELVAACHQALLAAYESQATS